MQYRNDYRKQIVFCGFSDVEYNSMQFYGQPSLDDDYIPYKKVPIYLYVKNLEEALKHQGLVLFIKVKKGFDPLEFDKQYRKKLNYWYIYYYNEEYTEDKRFSKYSNLYQMDEGWLFADWYDGFTSEIDDYFKEHPKLNIQSHKKEILDNIHKYMKKKKEVSTNDLSTTFNISIRNIQRYMKEINILYNDIGYDYSKNVWYICR